MPCQCSPALVVYALHMRTRCRAVLCCELRSATLCFSVADVGWCGSQRVLHLKHAKYLSVLQAAGAAQPSVVEQLKCAAAAGTASLVSSR
jgi:hypothetical protein